MGANRWRVARRLIAGSLLLMLGLALWGSQASSPDAGRQAFGLGLLLIWSAAAVGVFGRRRWGRWLGLLLSATGFVVALRAMSQSGPDGDPALLDLFFLADGPSFTWFGVGMGSGLFAVLSAIVGVLLVGPIDVPVRRGSRTRLAVPAAAGILLAGGLLLVVPFALRLPTYHVTWGIPPGGQVVRVSRTDDTVRIDPSTVHAGTVYLLFDPPDLGAVLIGGSSTPPEDSSAMGLEPLTDADVQRISRGDTFHTGTWAGLGHITELAVSPGSYLLAVDDPMMLAQRGDGTAPPGTIAVLRVEP